MATDRTDALTITINGKVRELPTQTFQGYFDLDLTRGVKLVVELNGATLEQSRLPSIPEGNNALYIVGGVPTLVLADYKKLGAVTDHKGNAGFTGRPDFGPLSRSDVELLDVDTVTRTASFDHRAVIVGPDAPLPAGGQVNPISFEKFPIYRLERVPAGADAFDTIGPRVTHELGRDRLPGTR